MVVENISVIIMPLIEEITENDPNRKLGCEVNVPLITLNQKNGSDNCEGDCMNSNLLIEDITESQTAKNG